jgi:hypothetical protein
VRHAVGEADQPDHPGVTAKRGGGGVVQGGARRRP